MRRIRRMRDDRGAAAVEFALILPVLIVLLLGIFEFGRIYNVQISLSNAAREGARTMAIANNSGTAKTAAIAAAPALNPAIGAGQISVSPGTCTAGVQATVTITYSVTLLSGFFGTTMPLEGKGAMRCGG